MSNLNDGRFERGNLVGNTSSQVVRLPAVRGNARRHDPDGTHSQAYFSGLTGTSLALDIGVVGGATSNFTVNFTTDNYDDAVAAVNAVSPTNFKWLESDGFAAIQNQNSGGKNFIRITGGTAAPILGLAIAPTPGSYSQAGDLAAAPGTRLQSNPQSTELIAHDEELSASVINRAIVGALLGTDKRLSDLDKPFAYYVTLPATQYKTGVVGASDTVRVTGSLLNRISIKALLNATSLQSVVALLSTDTVPVPEFDASGNLITILAVSYGASDSASPTSQAVTWGSPPANPGATLDGTLAASYKVPLINIASISGSTIVATGANFVTKNVVAGDVVTVQGATNNTPFNHDGEFVVAQVIDNDTIVVRSMGDNEDLISATEDRPRVLNSELPISTSYGQVGVYIGWSIQATGYTATSADAVFFKTSAQLAQGSTYTLRIPVVSTLREMLVDGLLGNISFNANPHLTSVKLTPVSVLPGTSNPAITTLSSDQTGNFLALWEDTDVAGNTFTLYLQPGGILLLAFNCKWSADPIPANSLWVSTVPTTSGGQGGGIVVALTGTLSATSPNPNPNIIVWMKYADAGGSANSWAYDGGWDQRVFNLGDTLAAFNGRLDLGSALMTTGGVSTLAQAKTARVSGKAPQTITGDATLQLFKIMEWGDSGKRWRMYVGTVNGEWRLTYNANWTGDSTGWQADIGGISDPAYTYVLGRKFAVAHKKDTSAAIWPESGWDAPPIGLDMESADDSLDFIGSVSLSEYVDMPEIADPAAPTANHGRYYFRSNGLSSPNHRTQFVVEWPDGTQTVIAESAAS